MVGGNPNCLLLALSQLHCCSNCIGQTGAKPELGATEPAPTLGVTGAATANTSTAIGSAGSGTIGAAPSSGANAVCEEKEKIEPRKPQTFHAKNEPTT